MWGLGWLDPIGLTIHAWRCRSGTSRLPRMQEQELACMNGVRA